jgi:hypothetical protein
MSRASNLAGFTTSISSTTDLNVGIITATSVAADTFYGDGSELTGIVAGATLSNSSGTDRLVLTDQTSGTMTSAKTSSNLTYDSSANTLGVGTTGMITVGSAFIKDGQVGLGTISTTGRNAGVGTAVGTLIYNATTTSVEVYTANGWKTVYQNFSASGGTLTTAGGKNIHTFTSTGSFVVDNAQLNFNVDYLVVAGGGGGNNSGGFYASGAGGAGGMRTGTGLAVSTGIYTVIVGGGGATNPGSSSPGNVSSISGPGISTISATGGGSGGSPGGSGGGGGNGNAGGYNPPEGNPGIATPASFPNSGGALGGGGAFGPSTNSVPGYPGSGQWSGGSYGGNGLVSSISGSAVTYAGGGGGGQSANYGSVPGGNGGSGGGGRGGTYPATPALPGSANLGGGGGSGATNGNAYSPGGIQDGKSGGSGIVIISYPS